MVSLDYKAMGVIQENRKADRSLMSDWNRSAVSGERDTERPHCLELYCEYIQLLSKYLLTACYMLGSLLRTGVCQTENKEKKSL